MNSDLSTYLNQFNTSSSSTLKALEEEAETNQIPIMEKDGIAFLKQLMRLQKPLKVLEIGTAIGYSALQMASVNQEIKIVTVERDRDRYERAKIHVANYDDKNQIQLFLGDAFDLSDELNQQGPFDLVFIDAAKGQYQRFFETFSQNMTDNGVIITDNVLFKGYVYDDASATDRLKKLSKKINRYNAWLSDLEEYETVIVPVGDGIAITTKKGSRAHG